MRGRKSIDAGLEILGPLTAADLREAQEPSPEAAPLLKELRDSHHAVARYLAMGMDENEVAAITGYTQARISVLKQDPAFQQLLDFYRGRETESHTDLMERMRLLAQDGIQELARRVRDTPQELATAALTDLTTKLLDRSGYAPVNRILSLTATLPADELRSMKEAINAQERVSTPGGPARGSGPGGESPVRPTENVPAECETAGGHSV